MKKKGKVGCFRGGERVGEGEGTLFLLPWGRGGGKGGKGRRRGEDQRKQKGRIYWV